MLLGDTSGCYEVTEAKPPSSSPGRTSAPPGVQLGRSPGCLSPDGELRTGRLPFPEGHYLVTPVRHRVRASLDGADPCLCFRRRPGVYRSPPTSMQDSMDAERPAVGCAGLRCGQLGLYRRRPRRPWEEIPAAGLSMTSRKTTARSGRRRRSSTNPACDPVVLGVDQRSQPLRAVGRPILGRDRAGDGRRVRGRCRPRVFSVSKDLADWKAVSTSHLGEFVDSP